MAENSTYTPAKVWQWNKKNGGQFANINRPTAGATHDRAPGRATANTSARPGYLNGSRLRERDGAR